MFRIESSKFELRTDGEKCSYRIGELVSEINFKIRNEIAFQYVFFDLLKGRMILADYSGRESDVARKIFEGMEKKVIEHYMIKF